MTDILAVDRDRDDQVTRKVGAVGRRWLVWQGPHSGERSYQFQAVAYRLRNRT